jgi:hypothetical protein
MTSRHSSAGAATFGEVLGVAEFRVLLVGGGWARARRYRSPCLDVGPVNSFSQAPHELIGAPEQGEGVVALGRTDRQGQLDPAPDLGHGLGIPWISI